MGVVFQKGQSIGPYTVIEAIKKGGMAQIYRARVGNSRQEVAVKVSLLTGADPVHSNALRQEVDILKDINHDGVIRVLPIPLQSAKEKPYMARLNIPGQPWYYAMELMRGGSLASLLKDSPQLPLDLASALGMRVADTLMYLHTQRIIHLDIKPENILLRFPLRPNGAIEPVLIDFGVSCRGIYDLRAKGGTLATMSPEYIRNAKGNLPRGDKLDLRMTDAYALGVVMYRLWTGQYPFKGRTEGELTSEILTKKPAPPRTLNPNLPGNVDLLMEQWLEKDPLARPTLDEIWRDLNRLSSGMKRLPPNFKLAAQNKPLWKFW
jgi:serine/threonine-protein kinase